MFSTSSQKKFFTFENEEQLERLRYNANYNYIHSIHHGKKFQELSKVFLTADEELLVVRHYEKALREFFQKFKPRQQVLPLEVKGTAVHYFKRFFLVNSVMDYHPREIMITCIFLACKVCEYFVPIDMFVKSIEGDPNLLKNIILDQELEVLARIKFRIHIINPYRAIEGILIDLKTRHRFHDTRRLGDHINKFMSCMWFTDVCLLHSPSQIALSAVMHACSKCKENIDDFILTTFLHNPSAATLNNIINHVRGIRTKVMNLKPLPSMDEITQLEARLARCRNPYNNPTSTIFKTRMQEYALENYVSSSPGSSGVSK